MMIRPFIRLLLVSALAATVVTPRPGVAPDGTGHHPGDHHQVMDAADAETLLFLPPRDPRIDSSDPRTPGFVAWAAAGHRCAARSAHGLFGLARHTAVAAPGDATLFALHCQLTV